MKEYQKVQMKILMDFYDIKTYYQKKKDSEVDKEEQNKLWKSYYKLKTATLDELIDLKKVKKQLLLEYVLVYHHPYIKRSKESISSLWKKYVMDNNSIGDDAAKIHLLFTDFIDELLRHVREEENTFFPLVALMEKEEELPDPHMLSYINEFTHDHDETMGMTNVLTSMIERDNEQKTNPELLTYYNSIQDFIRKLYEHIYIEQEILFPVYREQIEQLMRK